jgi:molybdenum cofactor cytidylyltransferase
MTGIIILAAGSSSRLGRPKQNLLFKGKTLLQNTIETTISSKANPVIVILGANADVIKPYIEKYPVHTIYNTDWHEGMASSIRLGVKELLKTDPGIDSLILMLCDQPFVDIPLLDQLIDLSADSAIIACAYNETTGPPALFNRSYFEELLGLKGSEGAKKLLVRYADVVTKLPFPLGEVDIDTIEDYENIKRSK